MYLSREEKNELAEVSSRAERKMKAFDGTARFVVRGKGFFPFDMLRHSRCWPTGVGMEFMGGFIRSEKVDIELRTSSWRGISEARWASFGWTVISITEEE